MESGMDRRGDAVTRTQRHTGRRADNDREDEGLQKNTRLQRRWAGRQKDTKAGRKRDSKRAREPGGEEPKRHKCQGHSGEADVRRDLIRSSARQQQSDRGRQERSQRSHEVTMTKALSVSPAVQSPGAGVTWEEKQRTYAVNAMTLSGRARQKEVRRREACTRAPFYCELSLNVKRQWRRKIK